MLFTNQIRVPFASHFRRKSSSGMSPIDYCVDLVRKHDRENFLCTLLLPTSLRNVAFVVRAFNIEVSQAVDKTSEDRLSLMRLQWWQNALDDIYKGRPPPNHPVAVGLARVVEKHKLLKKQLSRLIKARSEPLGVTGFESLNKMEGYVEETVSPVYYTIIQSAGITDMNADHAASHLGKAQGLINLIRAVPHHSARRQLFLPRDLLAKNSVSQEKLFRGETTQGLKDVIFEIASTSKIHLDKARNQGQDLPKIVKTIMLPSTVVDANLERMRSVDFDIFSGWLNLKTVHLGVTLLLKKWTGSY